MTEVKVTFMFSSCYYWFLSKSEKPKTCYIFPNVAVFFLCTQAHSCELGKLQRVRERSERDKTVSGLESVKWPLVTKKGGETSLWGFPNRPALNRALRGLCQGEILESWRFCVCVCLKWVELERATFSIIKCWLKSPQTTFPWCTVAKLLFFSY